MTAPRLARAGRSRFFIGLAALFLIMIGFVAIFHSSQQQLDESRKLRLRCEQQQEALNARMQAIVEHKFRVEKSLEIERKEHLETKQNFEQKTKEQKDMHSKFTLDSNARFVSLQQHYKLLQSEHNDLVEECAKTKETQLDEINDLERKVKSLQGQLQQAKTQWDKDIQHWKAKYNNMQQEKDRLEILLKSTKSNNIAFDNCKLKTKSLENIIAEYKKHCNYQPPAGTLVIPEKNIQNYIEPLSSGIEKSFNEQIAVSDDLYKVPIKMFNSTNKMHDTYNNSNISMVDGHINGNHLVDIKGGSVINSVENFQIAPKPLHNTDDQYVSNKGDNKEVLQQPRPLNIPLKSSTSSTDLKTSDNKRIPGPSFESLTSEKIKRSSMLANDRHNEIVRPRLKQIPDGVVPVPENFEAFIKNDDNNQSGNNNNRYANVVDAISGKKDESEKENVAHEIKDNDFNLGDDKNEPKDHLQEVLDNAAEEDTNNVFDQKPVIRSNRKMNGDEADDLLNNKHDKVELLEGEDKLINEVVGDQGKEAGNPDDVHLEEANEEDEDEDDYSNPAARQQEGPAVRN